MTPERDSRGPRQDKADPALRFNGKGETTEEPKSGGRPAGAWKKASARMRAEAQPEVTSPTTDKPEQGQQAPCAPGEPETSPTGEAPQPTGADPPMEGGVTDRAPQQTGDGAGPDTGADPLGQSVPKYRQRSRRADSAQPSAAQGKYQQESQQARPADKLRHDSGVVDGGSEGTGDKTPEPEPLRKARLRMERRESKLNTASEKLANQKPYKPPGPVRRAAGFAGRSAHGFVHGKIYQVEQENVGVEGAHRSELVGEAVGRRAVRYTKNRVHTRPARQVRTARARYVNAAADYRFQQAAAEHPELSKNALARLWRKRQQRKRYQKQAKEAAKQGAREAEKTAVTTEKLAARVAGTVKRHPVAALIVLLCLLLMVGLQSCMSSLAAVGNGITGSVTAATYPAEDADLLGAEAAYAGLETELQSYLDNYTATHSYDEYHFDLETIEHDPYVLLSILSALHPEGWTLADVENTLQALFDRQYTLTERVVVETRYDSEGEPYSWYVCHVTLTNENLSHLPVYIMGEEPLSRYAIYMASLGNRPDLFPSSAYVGKYTNPPTVYEVPPEALADATFAAMLEVAEKFVGYPYVWGGSSPATSFDCSGYLSYILNQCGWDVGRLGATGLYNYCTPTSDPQPGDLVFFVGTYDTTGVSHCGLYLGDGWMLHAGDPIGYANLNSSYWQSHFYAYGRLP